MDVGNVNCGGEQRGDLFGGEAGDAAADTGHEERQVLMFPGERDKIVNIRFYRLYPTLHCWDGIALSLQSYALSHDGAKPVNS